jgi:hypothetical protein
MCVMASSRGLEPRAPAFGGQRSILLSYEDMVRRGGLEPPCGMPGLQPGAVAATLPTHGVGDEI